MHLYGKFLTLTKIITTLNVKQKNNELEGEKPFNNYKKVKLISTFP